MTDRSANDPLPEHLVVLENVQIRELLTGVRGDRYFEVDHKGATLKVRVYDRPDTVEAIETHLNIPLDVTIFPYEWELAYGEKSGVINYYYNAKLHKSGE